MLENESRFSFICHRNTMEVRSLPEDSEFVRVLRGKISEETRRCGMARAVFWLDTTVPSGWLTLDRYLDNYGPFPVDSYGTASIIQRVATALLFLHQTKMAYGSLGAESIAIDLDGVAHVLPPPSAHGRHSMQDDIRSLGKLLLRLVTGQNEYPPPHPRFPVDASLLRLVGFMLETPMTAGQVLYHSTLLDILSEKHATFFFNQ